MRTVLLETCRGFK